MLNLSLEEQKDIIFQCRYGKNEFEQAKCLIVA